jgi:hypothetical protein
MLAIMGQRGSDPVAPERQSPKRQKVFAPLFSKSGFFLFTPAGE